MTLKGERAALERAATLLEAAIKFVDENRLYEYTAHWDGADCDGHCLVDDCEIALDDIRSVLK